jgi:high-affinity Fe2+/Pb2+ permease
VSARRGVLSRFDGHPFWAIFCGLFVLGLAAKFWWVIVLVAAAYCGLRAWQWWQVANEERRRQDELTAARADWEHQQFLAGNSIGWYGQYPPTR